MLDNQIIIAVRAATIARLLLILGVPVEVKQANQPTAQGIPSGPFITMHKIMDIRYGSPQRSERWDEDDQTMYLTQSEQMESTFQLSAVAPQNPADDTELTTADILKAAATALQSDSVMDTLRTAGLGVLRVRDVRNGYAVDDQGQFQANPTLDVTLTHRNTTVEAIGAINAKDVVIHSV